jgi:hypothetical protein
MESQPTGGAGASTASPRSIAEPQVDDTLSAAFQQAALVATAAGQEFGATSWSPALPSASPDDLGLVWEECPASEEGYPSLAAYSACFQHPWPTSQDVSATFGIWLKPGEFKLVIGQDTYATTTEEVPAIRGRAPREKGTLYRNGEPVQSLTATITAWYPTVALRDLAGVATWEFAGEDVATVVYDGHDLREVLGLQEVRRPHTINDKLIFVARRDG